MVRRIVGFLLISGIGGCTHLKKVIQPQFGMKGRQVPADLVIEESPGKAQEPQGREGALKGQTTVYVDKYERTQAPSGSASTQAVPQQAPPQYVAAPQQLVMAPMMPMMTAPVSGEVRNRTGMGFMFDSLKIPIPIIRPIPIQRPAEVTMQMPFGAQTAGYTMGMGGGYSVVSPTSFAAPMAVGGASASMIAPAQVQFAPEAITGAAQGGTFMAVPGQTAGFNSLGNNSPSGSAQGGPADASSERLKAAERKVDDLLRQIEDLKKGDSFPSGGKGGK